MLRAGSLVVHAPGSLLSFKSLVCSQPHNNVSAMAKALQRRATARRNLGHLEDAVRDLTAAYELQPSTKVREASSPGNASRHLGRDGLDANVALAAVSSSRMVNALLTQR